MKKKYKIIILILICLITSCLSYKFFLFFKGKTFDNKVKAFIENKIYEEDIDKNKLLNTNIKDSVIYTNNNTIIVNSDKDMNINVVCNDSKYINKNNNVICKADNNETCIKFFTEVNYLSNIDNFTSFIPMPDASLIEKEVNLTNIKPKKLLHKYNIKSNADLFKAMIKSMNNEVNFFSSNNLIRYNILMDMLLLYMPFTNFSDIYTISGNLDGNIIKINKTESNPDYFVSYVCPLTSNEYCYNIMFYNFDDYYFDYDKVIDILSNIEFN